MLFTVWVMLNLTYTPILAGPIKPEIPIEYEGDGIIWPDDGIADPTCGVHPLRSIVKKLENTQPNMDQEALVRLLSLMRNRAPKLWNSYQSMLAAYHNCKLISAGGSLG
uniref:Uncharacterized protein n=1 Tax=Acrobeloides nanus TaxID=290746 RepID=A0A914D9D9_9BILA